MISENRILSTRAKGIPISRDAEDTTLGGMLRVARERSGLRQVEVADALGVPQSVVSKYESGERGVDVVELIRICHVLQLDPSEVVRRIEREVRSSSRKN